MEAKNEAAKIHLAASLRMGDWLRNQAVKADSSPGNQYTQGMDRLQSATSPTYADLGIDKTDAFWVQRHPI